MGKAGLRRQPDGKSESIIAEYFNAKSNHDESRKM
jgi:hypothetical protein